MSGQLRFDGIYKTSMGICPQARLWNITGGYGAGGASCGPGGGGGAGFRGNFISKDFFKIVFKGDLADINHLEVVVQVLL